MFFVQQGAKRIAEGVEKKVAFAPLRFAFRLWYNMRHRKELPKMAKRTKPNQKRAHRRFTATALKVHPKNIAPAPMRGGYRI